MRLADNALALPLSGPARAATDLGVPQALPAQVQGASRWSASAWVFGRRGQAAQLAPGGVLGGSQVGGRLTYRLGRTLSLSGRAYSPLNDAAASEAALGVDWQPVRAAPVRLLAERRQAIGRRGRSAFSLMAYGGISERRIVGPVKMDAYAQAGLVGARSRDLFADGSLSIGVPIDTGERLKIGAGAWAAAQPGVSRVDIGPQLSFKLPLDGKNLRLSADWRLRVAGNASPGSGPAITLSTDF